VLSSAPRDLVSRVTSLTGACQNVVSSLAIASFATMLQSRTVALADGGTISPVHEAAAFGDVYRAAVILLVLAILMTLSLSRPRSVPGVSQPSQELVSSAL
jgi:hypothetical protein